MSQAGQAGWRRVSGVLALGVCLLSTATAGAQRHSSLDSSGGSPASTYLLASELASTTAFCDGTRKRNTDSGNDLPKSAAHRLVRPLGPLQRPLFGFREYDFGIPDPADRAAIAIRAPPGHLTHH